MLEDDSRAGGGAVLKGPRVLRREGGKCRPARVVGVSRANRDLEEIGQEAGLRQRERPRQGPRGKSAPGKFKEQQGSQCGWSRGKR